MFKILWGPFGTPWRPESQASTGTNSSARRKAGWMDVQWLDVEGTGASPPWAIRAMLRFVEQRFSETQQETHAVQPREDENSSCGPYRRSMHQRGRERRRLTEPGSRSRDASIDGYGVRSIVIPLKPDHYRTSKKMGEQGRHRTVSKDQTRKVAEIQSLQIAPCQTPD